MGEGGRGEEVGGRAERQGWRGEEMRREEQEGEMSGRRGGDEWEEGEEMSGRR